MTIPSCRNLLVALALLGATHGNAHAQNPPVASPPAYVHESWTVQEGLPVNSINHVIQARTGYIWLATFDGLVRFDGVRFTVFNTANSEGLRSNRLLTMYEGRDSTLWIITDQYQFVRFRDGRFTSFGSGEGLGDEVVQTLYEDSRGTVWFATSRGIGIVQGDRFVPVAREHLQVLVRSITERRDGSLWIGTTGHGLYRLTDRSRFERIAVDSALGHDGIESLQEEPDGTLWIAASRALWKDDGRTIAKVTIGGAPIVPIAMFRAPSQGQLYLMASSGIWRLVGGVPTPVVRYKGPLNQPTAFAHGPHVWYSSGAELYRDGRRVIGGGAGLEELLSIVRSVVVDREGSVWIATYIAGLHRLKPALFTTYGVQEGLASGNVYPVFADRAGNVWVGTYGAGTSRIDATTGRIDSFRSGPSAPGIVSSFAEERSGRLWLGSHQGPLACTALPLRCRPPLDEPAGIRTDVHALFTDRDGRVWAGTRYGIFRLDGEHWSYIAPGGVAALAPPTAGNNVVTPVRAFAQTRDGAIWMGTNGGGLVRYANGRFTAVTSADGLPSDLVRSLYADSGGWLWIGTEGRGLARLDPRSWGENAPRADRRIVRIGARDGLLDETIHQILPDDFGRVWMSGNRGIFWVARAELDAFVAGKAAYVHATAYTERDGLRNREANGGVQPAGARTPDGRLWFPTQDGVAVVNPASVRRDDRVAPPVVVERVLAGGAPLAAADGLLAVAADRRNLEIDYTAITFLEPANVRFRYRLEPYDADWVDAGNRRTAFYTRVPPGRYTFRVEASNGMGVWSGRSAPLELSVAPFFRETTMARALLALAVVTLVGAAFWWRLVAGRRREHELSALVDARTAALRTHEQQLAERNEQLSELMQHRSRLFANLSHEFRTPLTLILGPLRSLLDGRHGVLAPSAREQGELMQRNGQRLLRLINQILDLSRLQAGALTLERRPGDLIAFARTTTLAFAPLAERRGIALRFESEPAALTLAFDAEQLEKVLLNLLSNALKFTSRGGTVDVAVRADTGTAEIAVRDTGVGIAREKLPHVFDRFYQADASATRRYEGTGIGLALAKELVELHRGEIRAESEPGIGSTFTIRLPLDAPVLVTEVTSPVRRPDAQVEVAGTTLPTPEPPEPDVEVESTGTGALDEDRTTVLVVDDNPDVRAYVRSVLESSYRVLVAADGRAGLELARTALPDLIVADVMMPELDGLALARALKNDAMTDAIPVVLLTARAATEDQVAGFSAGADLYVLKPFDPAVLEAGIASLLAQRKRLRERFRQSGAPASTPTSTPAPTALERRLRPIVEARLMDEQLGPETLAEAAGMSYHQLYRALRDELETTPSRFIRGVRVECARELLRQRVGSVTEIAYSVGFESLSYFSRAYHERFGVPPSAHLGSPA